MLRCTLITQANNGSSLDWVQWRENKVLDKNDKSLSTFKYGFCANTRTCMCLPYYTNERRTGETPLNANPRISLVCVWLPWYNTSRTFNKSWTNKFLKREERVLFNVKQNILNKLFVYYLLYKLLRMKRNQQQWHNPFMFKYCMTI